MHVCTEQVRGAGVTSCLQRRSGSELLRAEDSTPPIRRTRFAKCTILNRAASDSLTAGPPCRYPSISDGLFGAPLCPIRGTTHDVSVRHNAAKSGRFVTSAPTCALVRARLLSTAVALPISSDSTYLLRKFCALLRSTNSGRVPWPYVDAPLVGKHDVERRAACGSGTVVCPASGCSHVRPRACMVFVRSDPNRLRELQCSSAKNWFFRPCLTDRLPLPCSPSCPHPVGTIAGAFDDAPCS